MQPDDSRREIEDIVAGKVAEGNADNCRTIRNYLCRRFATSTDVKKDFESRSLIKEEQAGLIEGYCDKHKLWVHKEDKCIAEQAAQQLLVTCPITTREGQGPISGTIFISCFSTISLLSTLV